MTDRTVDVLTAINLILASLTKIAEFAKVVDRARAEGRDLTAAEIEEFRVADDLARARLEAAIAARSGG